MINNNKKRKTTMIEVNNISFRYPGTKHNVFSNFNMSLEANNIYGLLGKNGTGKSTLLYLISGLLRPANGEVKVDGRLATDRQQEMLKDMFIVPEELNLPPETRDTYGKINKPLHPNSSPEQLEGCLKNFELPQTLKLNELSMGQKKKVYMSFALAAGTKYLFMDEPTNGLDIPSKTQFRRVIANNMSDERTLIISTHQVHDVETLLDHILILSESEMLLNSSVSNICEHFSFEYRQPQEMDDTVIYAEPTLQGNAVIAKRGENDDETQMNLELLFNAVATGKIKI